MTVLIPDDVLPPEMAADPFYGITILDDVSLAALKASQPGIFGFSPSQTDTFRQCKRKWGFRNIEGRYVPAGKGAALGTEVHAVWEAYLLKGTMPPKSLAGKIARPTLPYLPLPGIAIVEGETKMATPLGILTMRIDFWIPDQGAHQRGELGTFPDDWYSTLAGVPLIGDHKTTSDPDEYAKHPEDLLGDGTENLPGDAQAALYALNAHMRTQSTAIDLLWSYSATKGRARAVPVRARFDLTALASALRFLWSDVAQMRWLKANVKSANDIEPNPSACDAYGGCPYREHCTVQPEERLTEMGDMKALLGLSGSSPAPAPAAKVQPTLPGQRAAAPAASGGLAASLGVKTAPAAAPVAKPAPVPVAAKPAPVAGLGAKLGITPPAAKPAPAPVAEAPAEPVDRSAEFFEAASALFTAGQAPGEDAEPELVAAYDELVARANPVPPDAGPEDPEPVAAAEPEAPPAPAPVIEQKPRGRKGAALPVVADVPAGGKDPRALLVAALDAAKDANNFVLVSSIAAVIAGFDAQAARQ